MPTKEPSGKVGMFINKGKRMSPQPLADTPLNELFQRRRDLENSYRDSFMVDEVAALRLGRDLQAEADSDRVTPIQRGALFHELAYVEAIRGRLDAALAGMRKAEGCGSSSIMIAVSTAHVFTMFGRFKDARSVLEKFKIHEAPKSSLGSFRGLCEETGMYEMAASIRIDGAPSEYLSEEAHRILREANISDVEATEILDCAASFVAGRVTHRLIAYDLFAMEGEGILFRFVVDASHDQLLKLDWDVTEMLASKFDSLASSILSIGIKPFSKGEKHQGYGAYRASV